MIIIEKTSLDRVLLIRPSVFEDFRGQYVELYNEKEYQEKGISVVFVQDDISISRKGVLRGIHGDNNTWKLISCLQGAFYLAVVNCEDESPDYGAWQGFTLSDINRRQVLIPPRHGNGHLVLTETAIFHYKQSTYYEGAERQFTYRYDDKRFCIWWPIGSPVLSRRDEGG